MALNSNDFMRRVLAWPDDMDKGHIGVWLAGKFPDGKPWMSGRPVRTLQQFWQTVQDANQWSNPVDIYMCLSQQARTKPRERDGKIVSMKHQSDAVALKSLWLDVDVGKEKGYQSREAALTGITSLCEAAGLPSPSAVVGSGGGLHVYWINKTALPPADWQPWADALKAVALKHMGADFFDAVCTGDSARILRVPGTWNRKKDPPRPVELLELQETDYDFEVDLSSLRSVDTAGTRLPRPSSDDALTGAPLDVFAGTTIDLGAGITATEPWIVDFDNVAPVCGFIKEALDTGGAAFGQPLWNYTNLLATFGTGGREDAHRMARGHPQYSSAETDLQFDRKLEERRVSGVGPVGCKAIQEAGCTHCATCPLLALGKSPIHHARVPRIEPVAGGPSRAVSSDVVDLPLRPSMAVVRDPKSPRSLTDDDMPAGYIIRDDVPYKRELILDKKTGELVPKDLRLFACKIYDPWTQALEGDNRALNFTVSLDIGHYKECSLTNSQMSSETCNRELRAQSVNTWEPNRQHLGTFFMHWLGKLHAEAASRDAVSMGWLVDKESAKPKGFSYGGTFYGVDGTRQKAGIGDPRMMEVWSPRGNIDVWLQCCKSITDQNRPEIEILVAAGFASPLAFMTGKYNSMLAACCSDSGVYKTTAARTGMAIWGNPKFGCEMEGATLGGVLNKAGLIRNLPIVWDEIAHAVNLEKVGNFLRLSTQGAEGSRLTSDIKQQRRGEWQLMSILCSNYSIGNFISAQDPTTAASLLRVLEWHPKPMDPSNPARMATVDADRLYGALDYNYGHIGARFIEMVTTNFQATDDMIVAQSKSLEAEWKMTNRERYWGAMASTVLVAATLANELGCEFHVDGIKECLHAAVIDNRTRIGEEVQSVDSPENITDLLTAFLQAMQKHIIVREPDGLNGFRMPIKPEVGVPCHVEWDAGMQILKLSKGMFRSWVSVPTNRQGPGWNPRQATKALQNKFKADPGARLTIGAGTRWRVIQSAVIAIPISGNPELEGMLKALQGGDDPEMKHASN